MASPIALTWDLIATDNASAAFTRVGAAADESAAKTTHGMDMLTKLGEGVALAVVAAAAGAVHMAMEMQDADAKIAGSAQISTDAAKTIGDAFLSTAGTSTFSGKAMADAFGPVAGVIQTLTEHTLTAADSMAFMKTATTLAEASGTDLTATTGDLAAVMQNYGISVDSAELASNTLFNTSRLTNIDLDTLTTTVDKLHGKLGIAAPGLVDVAALLDDLANHGVSGSKGVLVVSSAMNTLLGGAKPVSAELAKLGVNVFDSSGQFVGMGQVLTQLTPKLAGMTDEQRRLAEETLFGKSAAAALDSTIMAGVAGLNDATAAVTKHGAAEDAAKAKADTLSGQIKTLKAVFSDLMTELGEKIIPVLQKVIDWMMKHKTVVEVLAGVIGGVLVVAMVAAAAAFVIGTGVVGLITAAIAACAAGVIYAYTHFKTFHDIVNAVGSAVAAAWKWIRDETVKLWPVVVSLAKGALDWLKNAWNDLSSVTQTLWNKVSGWVKTAIKAIQDYIAPLVTFVKSHWDEIKQVTEVVWTYIKAYFSIIWGAIKAIFDVVMPLIIGILKIAWDIIKTTVEVVWAIIKGIFQTVWDAIVMVFKVVRDVIIGIVSVFLDIVTGHWSQAWNDIKTFVINIWHDISDGVGKIANDFWKMLVGIFNGLKDGMAGIWHDIWDTAKSVFTGGINGVIDLIDGFLHAINSIAGAVGMTLNLNVDHIGGGGGGGGAPSSGFLDPLNGGGSLGPDPGLVPLHASGAVMSIGPGFSTNGPQAIVGEGNPMHPEFVIPTDPQYRDRARELFKSLGGSLGVPGLAGGGILGDIGSLVSDTWSGIKDVAGAATSIAKEGLAKLLETTWPVLPTDSSIGALLPGGINHLRDAAIKLIEDKDAQNKASGGGVGPPGSMPSGNLAGWEATALAILGKDYGAFAPGLSQLIGHESGGNPNAINLTDSNAAAGHPSKGLMQTIDSTFNAYALPGHGNIWDPVDNIIAGFRYAEANYGDLMIIGGGRSDGSGGYLGYDEGGLLMPGYSQVFNGTGQPEIIVPPGAGQTGGAQVTIHVHPAQGQSETQIATEVERRLTFAMR